jgi:two-component system CheB/CheR fusion protein
LVDDQPARLLTYESILEGVGVRCIRALSGEEALARVLRERFALILLDVSMPVMDGFQTARLIREHPRFELTPIIFVTGVNITELDTLRGYEAGAIDYISVPIVPEILRSKVALLVELYRRRTELEMLNGELSAARERLQAERNNALAATEARREKEWLAAVLDSISDEVYFTDTEGRYTYANPAAMRESGHGTVQGLKLTELLARLEVFRSDGSPRPLEEAPPLRALRGENVRNEEQIVRIPRTGELRHRQVSSAPVRDTQERIIGSVSVARDVTEIRMHEQELRRIEREHAQLLDVSSDAIFVWELEGAIQYWNRGASELYGFTSNEAVGRVSHELLSTVHPDGMHLVLEELRQRGSWRGELTHRTRTGAVLAVQSSMQVVPRGTKTLIMESNRDLTERKQNEDLLREADRRKDEFLAVLSHELRNPLAPIRNVAEYLNLFNASEPRLDWARRVLHRQVTHMSRILDDLLDVTRITSGRLILKKRPVSLNEVVEAAIETTRSSIDEKKHDLAVDLPSTAPMLDGDPVRLTQVISNLLTNSAKYTDRGGLIELSAHVEDHTLSIRVKDNGIGIPSEQIPRLFKMFAQAPDARDRAEGGLGIGLALAKGILELHGGTIEARSLEGSGSEFQIRLPLLESEPALGVASEEAPPRHDAKLRILIADDNRDAAESLALLLRLEHHDVQVAHDGRSALSLTQTFHPNVVLLDIGMPELDGYEVARALRQEPATAGICLIALTGRGREEDARQAMEAGFDFHLRKPCELADLRGMIAAHRSCSGLGR